jgi:hypothetical protein
MKNTQNQIDLINANLKAYPELVDLFYNILTIKSGYSCFSKLCEMAEVDKNKIDSAYPVDYGNSMREIYPNFVKGRYCFDYSQNRVFGELLNLNDKLVDAIFKPLH